MANENDLSLGDAAQLANMLKDLERNHFDKAFRQGFIQGFCATSGEMVAASHRDMYMTEANGLMFGAVARAIYNVEKALARLADPEGSELGGS